LIFLSSIVTLRILRVQRDEDEVFGVQWEIRVIDLCSDCPLSSAPLRRILKGTPLQHPMQGYRPYTWTTATSTGKDRFVRAKMSPRLEINSFHRPATSAHRCLQRVLSRFITAASAAVVNTSAIQSIVNHRKIWFGSLLRKYFFFVETISETKNYFEIFWTSGRGTVFSHECFAEEIKSNTTCDLNYYLKFI